MAAWRSVLLAAVVLAAAPSVRGCVYLMGDAKDSVAPHPMPVHWDYSLRGEDWDGYDASNKSWSCISGSKQSPLNLVTGSCATGSSNVKTSWHYEPLASNGSNVAVYNNGHTIQVQWTGAMQSNVIAYAATKITDVLDPSNAGNLKPVKLQPLQFHFHTTSEHMIDGAYAPIEMHIVHSVPQSVLPGCPASGCLSVVGIMMHVSNTLEDGPDTLDRILDMASQQEGVMEWFDDGDVLNIEDLLPPPDQRSYMQYEGSLTTPPCTEGLLWHVLKTPVHISLAQYDTYAKAVGLKECRDLNATRRRLQQEAHHHHHHGHTHGAHDHVHHYADLLNDVASFQRGSYSGFVSGEELRHAQAAVHSLKKKEKRRHAKSHRKLQEESGSSDSGSAQDDWVCDVVAYGWTNRNPQGLNGRNVITYN